MALVVFGALMTAGAVLGRRTPRSPAGLLAASLLLLATTMLAGAILGGSGDIPVC